MQVNSWKLKKFSHFKYNFVARSKKRRCCISSRKLHCTKQLFKSILINFKVAQSCQYARKKFSSLLQLLWIKSSSINSAEFWVVVESLDHRSKWVVPGVSVSRVEEIPRGHHLMAGLKWPWLPQAPRRFILILTGATAAVLLELVRDTRRADFETSLSDSV